MSRDRSERRDRRCYVDAGIVPLIYGIKHLALRISIWDDLLLRAHLDENYQTVMSDISERKTQPRGRRRRHISLRATASQKRRELSAHLVKSKSSSGFGEDMQSPQSCAVS